MFDELKAEGADLKGKGKERGANHVSTGRLGSNPFDAAAFFEADRTRLCYTLAVPGQRVRFARLPLLLRLSLHSSSFADLLDLCTDTSPRKASSLIPTDPPTTPSQPPSPSPPTQSSPSALLPPGSPPPLPPPPPHRKKPPTRKRSRKSMCSFLREVWYSSVGSCMRSGCMGFSRLRCRNPSRSGAVRIGNSTGIVGWRRVRARKRRRR